MRECYIPQKIIDLFHVKHIGQAEQQDMESKIARIMNIMHSEILLANRETERRLARKLELLLRSEL